MSRLLSLLIVPLLAANLFAADNYLLLPFQFYPLGTTSLDGSRGSLVLGTLRSVKPIRLPEGNRFPMSREYVRISLDVERTLVGIPLTKGEQGFAPVGYEPTFYRADLKQGAPQVGDRVFFIKRDQPDRYDLNPDPLACLPFEPGPSLAQATDAEIARIDRAMKIIALKDSPQSTQLVIQGCADADPRFAVWCLEVLNPNSAELCEGRQKVYGPIPTRITPQQYVELLWQRLADPSAHWRVFTLADRLLAQHSLSAADQTRRHQLHLRRLDAILASPEGQFQSHHDAELRHLIAIGPASMPIEHCRATLQELANRLPTIPGEKHREMVAWLVGCVCDDRHPNDQIYAAVVDFYHQIDPLDQANQNVPAWAYCSGVHQMMKYDSAVTRVTSDEGLDLLANLIERGDQTASTQAAQTLIRYIDFSRRNRIDVTAAENRVKSLIKVCPHADVQDELGAAQERWEKEAAAKTR